MHTLSRHKGHQAAALYSAALEETKTPMMEMDAHLEIAVQGKAVPRAAAPAVEEGVHHKKIANALKNQHPYQRTINRKNLPMAGSFMTISSHFPIRVFITF